MNKPLPTEATVLTKFLQHISLTTQGLETLLSNQRDQIQVPDKGPCSSQQRQVEGRNQIAAQPTLCIVIATSAYISFASS